MNYTETCMTTSLEFIITASAVEDCAGVKSLVEVFVSDQPRVLRSGLAVDPR